MGSGFSGTKGGSRITLAESAVMSELKAVLSALGDEEASNAAAIGCTSHQKMLVSLPLLVHVHESMTAIQIWSENKTPQDNRLQ